MATRSGVNLPPEELKEQIRLIANKNEGRLNAFQIRDFLEVRCEILTSASEVREILDGIYKDKGPQIYRQRTERTARAVKPKLKPGEMFLSDYLKSLNLKIEDPEP